MARPVLQGRKVVGFQGTTSNPTAISLTSGWATGAGGANYTPVTNDVVIVGYNIGTASNADVDVTMATAGYTEETELWANDSAAANLAVYTKRMGGTPDTTVQPGPTTNNAYAGAVTIEVWSGVNTTTLLDVAVQTATGINGAVPTPPAITPSTTDAVVVCIAGGAATTGAVFTQSGSELSGFQSVNSLDTTDSFIGAGHFDWTSGTFTPTTWTGGVTGSAPSWAAVSLALRPAGGGATSLTVAAANSATTAANVTIAPKTALTVAAANSATTAASPLLRGIDIVPAAANSATTAANVTLPYGYPYDLPTATVTLTANQYWGYTSYAPASLAANSVVNANWGSWIVNSNKNDAPTTDADCDVGTDPTQSYPINIVDGGADIFIHSVFINGMQPQGYAHSPSYCGSPVGLRFEDCPGPGIGGGGPTISDVRIDNTWDGIRCIYSNDWTIRRVYMSNVRDDAIENDSQEAGTIDSVLVDGCLAFMACDSSSNPPMMGSQQHVNINRAIVRQKLFDQAGVMTHGSPFKYDTDSVEQRALNPTLTITNSVFAISTVSHAGKARLEEAWDKLTPSGHSNNTYINLSAVAMPGSYPFPPAHANFTIINQDGTNQAGALAAWESAKAAFLADFPHLARMLPVKHTRSYTTSDIVTFGTSGSHATLVVQSALSATTGGTTADGNWGPSKTVNGNFSSSTGWTVPASWSISGGKATATNAGTGTANKLLDAFRVPLRSQASRIKVDVQVDSISAGQLRRTIGGGTATRNTTGLWSETITITSFNENDAIEWSGDSSTTTFSGVIDDVAVYVDNQINLTPGAPGTPQIQGAAAVSVTTAGSPTLLGVDLQPQSAASATSSASPTLGGIDLVVQPANSATTGGRTANGNFGPNLISNGTFVNSTGWTTDTNWAISGGTGRATAATNLDFLTNTQFTNVEANRYKFEFELVIANSGTLQAWFSNTFNEYTTAGVKSVTYNGLTPGNVRFSGKVGAAFTGQVDYVAVYEDNVINLTYNPPVALVVQGASSVTKSHGYDLGPDMLAGAGTFDNPALWDSTAATGIWTVAGGILTAAGVTGPVEHVSAVPVVGQEYRMEFTVLSLSAGDSIRAIFGGSGTLFFGTLGGRTQDIVPVDTGTAQIYAGNLADATVDNFTIKAVNVINLLPKTPLVVQPANSATTAATAQVKQQLTVNAANSATTSASPTLAPKTTLTVQPANSATTAQNVSMLQVLGHPAISATTAANVILLPKWVLAVQAANSQTISISPNLTPRWLIVGGPVSSTSTAGNIALTYTFTINVLAHNELPVFYPSLRQHEQPVWPTSYV